MKQPLESSWPWRRILRLFRPSGEGLRFLRLVFSLLAALLGCVLLVFLAVGPTTNADFGRGQAFLLLVGFFLLPLLTLLLAVAALREPRHPPGVLLWSLAAFSFFVAGFLVSFLMFLDPELEKGVPAVFLLLVILPVALLLSLPAIYSLALTVPEVRAVMQAAVEQRALDYIAARGAVALGELSSLLDIPLAEIDDLLDRLLRSGQLAGTLDMTGGMVFTAAYLAEQQRQLLEWLNLRGHLRIEELARLLKTSPATVIDWLYQLVQRGQFNGYINWGKNLIYAADARKIGADSQCPSCGGALAPGGHGRIVCLHCGSELLGRLP